jgi:hypothetical protein
MSKGSNTSDCSRKTSRHQGCVIIQKSTWKAQVSISKLLHGDLNSLKFCHLENTQMLAEAKHKIATIFPSLGK